MKKLIIASLLVIILSGCAIQTKITAFYTEDSSQRGTIAVVPANQVQKESLEFANIAKKLEDKLTQVGYTRRSGNSKPDFAATVVYGIDGGRTILESDGTTGVEFARDIRIVIFKIGEDKPKKVYEINATSIGSCRTVTAVLPAIFNAIFEKFPPQNGVTERRIVMWDGRC